MGRRLWQRDYTDGNGGNITVRVGDNLALCTPTLICKGFMKPEDMCLVDLDGNQLAGTRVRTSEAKTHFGIMKRQPAAKSCVHAHPPHATAFAIANVDIPSCLIPEAEVFLGKIGVAKYQTPGTPANADEVGEVGKIHQAVLMQNHGVICWGKDVEDAYWKMENIDSYCRTVWIAAGLGGVASVNGWPGEGTHRPAPETRHARPACRSEGVRTLRQRRFSSRGRVPGSGRPRPERLRLPRARGRETRSRDRSCGPGRHRADHETTVAGVVDSLDREFVESLSR